VTDAGVLPQLSVSLQGLPSVQSFGATYEFASSQWVHVDRAYLSPDGKSFAYWTTAGSNDNSVHVLDLATGVDRVLYRGSTLFIVIAFEAKGIYLVHGIAPRQGLSKSSTCLTRPAARRGWFLEATDTCSSTGGS
jgi:hypothetical protein